MSLRFTLLALLLAIACLTHAVAAPPNGKPLVRLTKQEKRDRLIMANQKKWARSQHGKQANDERKKARQLEPIRREKPDWWSDLVEWEKRRKSGG